MKHTVRLLALLFALALLLTGCTKDEPETETVYYTVTFDANGGSAVPSMTVASGSKISEPDEPTRENYIFDGWVKGSESWNFSYHTVTSDITLKASWKSSDSVFGYRTVEGTDTAYLTALKSEHATLTIPSAINGFRVVGLDADIFADLSSEKVKKIVVPDTVTEIGDGAFANSTGVEIVIEGCLLTVGERAFLNCDGLRTVCIADGATRVSAEAFAGSGLKSVILPSSLTVIEEGAFQKCTSLAMVVLHGKMASYDGFFAIEDSAFRECDALKVVFLYGTEADKDALLGKTDNQNTPFEEARFCYYSETEPLEEGDYWYLHDGEPRMW